VLKEIILASKDKEGYTKTQAIAKRAANDELVKENKLKQFFEFLDAGPGDYTQLVFTPEETTRVRKHLSHLSTGSTAAVPIYCAGNNCPFKHACPLLAIGKVVLHQPCLVETELLTHWRKKYIIEYDIDVDSMTEVSMANELAEIELLLWRVNTNLSKPEYAELVQEDVVAIDREGNVLTKKNVSALMDVREKLTIRKSRLIKLMVGDRQEKYKREAALKIREEEDPSTSAADLRRSLQRLIAQATKATEDQKQLTETTEQEVTNKEIMNVIPTRKDELLTPELFIHQVIDQEIQERIDIVTKQQKEEDKK
jgi:hypothetical protein